MVARLGLRMSAQRRRASLLVLFVALVWTLPAAQAHAARKPCPRAATQTSDVARLYIRSDEDFNNELVACVKKTRKRFVLASWFSQGSSTDDPAPQAWLTGRFAAVNQASCPGDPSSTEPCVGTLKVIDLRTRRRHATVTTGAPIFDLVLTRRGSVGMIHRTELITAVGADVRVLDRGAEQYSMAYAASLGRLYWTSAGAPHSTSLR
jgi:hypothetical protein